jgi:hypothetical protein
VLPRGNPYSSAVELLERAGLPSRRCAAVAPPRLRLDDGPRSSRRGRRRAHLRRVRGGDAARRQGRAAGRCPRPLRLLDLHRPLPARHATPSGRRSVAAYAGRLRVATKYPRGAGGSRSRCQVDVIETRIDRAGAAGRSGRRGIVDLWVGDPAKNGLMERPGSPLQHRAGGQSRRPQARRRGRGLLGCAPPATSRRSRARGRRRRAPCADRRRGDGAARGGGAARATCARRSRSWARCGRATRPCGYRTFDGVARPHSPSAETMRAALGELDPSCARPQLAAITHPRLSRREALVSWRERGCRARQWGRRSSWPSPRPRASGGRLPLDGVMTAYRRRSPAGRIVVCSSPRPGGGVATGVAAACAHSASPICSRSTAPGRGGHSVRHAQVPRCDIIVGPSQRVYHRGERQVLGDVAIAASPAPRCSSCR